MDLKTLLVAPSDIPAFTADGSLPFFAGNTLCAPAMAPYATTLAKIAKRFCFTDNRCKLFRGLVEYRQALADIGLTGFLWIGGSFVTNAEAPQDIDAVIFSKRPSAHESFEAWRSFVMNNLLLFEPKDVKARFSVDPQFVDLDRDAPYLIERTRFWFGVFATTRDLKLKGFLQVSL